MQQHDRPSPKPRHNKTVRVMFRNGEISRDAREVSKWRWGLWPHGQPDDWDIIKCRVEE